MRKFGARTIVPPSGSSSPAMTFRSVDLPSPLRPVSAARSPLEIDSATLSSTGGPPNAMYGCCSTLNIVLHVIVLPRITRPSITLSGTSVRPFMSVNCIHGFERRNDEQRPVQPSTRTFA